MPITSRGCSIILIGFGVVFLVLAACHASVGFYGGYPAAGDHHTSGVVGDDIVRRRKMIATSPHASPSSHRSLQKLLRTSSEHEEWRPPPSPGTTENSSLDGDDVTKKKEGIRCSGGKRNDGVVAGKRCRRGRRLIAANSSDSEPAPGYRR